MPDTQTPAVTEKPDESSSAILVGGIPVAAWKMLDQVGMRALCLGVAAAVLFYVMPESNKAHIESAKIVSQGFQELANTVERQHEQTRSVTNKLADSITELRVDMRSRSSSK